MFSHSHSYPKKRQPLNLAATSAAVALHGVLRSMCSILRCPSTEEWITKMWYIHTMEYYAAEKNNDIMKFAGKWMELEDVILSKELSFTAVDKSLQMCAIADPA
ncbi:hypothetical protein STEG23_002667, partial [Scotinomys teguina]